MSTTVEPLYNKGMEQEKNDTPPRQDKSLTTADDRIQLLDTIKEMVKTGIIPIPKNRRHEGRGSIPYRGRASEISFTNCYSNDR